MHMHKKHGSALVRLACAAIVALTAAATTQGAPARQQDSNPTTPRDRSAVDGRATAQTASRGLSNGDALRAAEVMRRNNISLTKAIDAAEDHCAGQAIDARCRAMAAPGSTGATGVAGTAGTSSAHTLMFDVTCLDKAGQLMVVSVDGATGKVATSANPTGLSSGHHPMIVKASDFISGRDVVNAANEKIADMDELAIDINRGRVAYAVLDLTGGVNRLIAVPWSALKHHGTTCQLDLKGTQSLPNAPSFDRGTWPNMTTNDFGRPVADYYGRGVYGDDVALPQGSSLVIMKASEIIGGDVRSAADENLGDIEELVLDPQSGRVAYAVLSFGGFLGIGDKLFAVPMDSLTRRTDGNWVLAVTKEKLKDAPGFDKKNWPNMADPALDVQLRDFYRQTATTR